MTNTPNPGATCPDGGSFYICENNATEFVGCCILDPCADDSGKCARDDLRPASFWSENHDKIPEQECTSLSKETKWYICANDKTNFMGRCYHANPCIAGSCQPGYFAPARLSSNRSDREAFIEEVLKAGTSSSTPSSTTATSSIGISSGFHTEFTAGTTTSAAAGGAEGFDTGAIVGITLASTITAIAILAFLVFKCRARCGLRGVAPGQFITRPANVSISPSTESFGPRHPSMSGPTIPVLVELDGNHWAPSNEKAHPGVNMARSGSY